MFAPIPLAGRSGSLVSATAVGLWIVEQITGQMVFEFLTVRVPHLIEAAIAVAYYGSIVAIWPFMVV